MEHRNIVPNDQHHYYQDWLMSPGMTGGGLLFLTGMTGHRSDNTFAEDPEEQIRDAFARIGDVLAEAGLEWDSLVEMTSYHIGLQNHIEVFREVRAEYVREPYPAWTAIEVTGFVTPGAIVEIRAVADATTQQT
jgi:enamine deaminase RidA (YjgF/YER057c/UK114 family)